MSTSLKMAPGHGRGGQLTGMAYFAIHLSAVRSTNSSGLYPLKGFSLKGQNEHPQYKKLIEPFFAWKLTLKNLGHLNIWVWKPLDATCGSFDCTPGATASGWPSDCSGDWNRGKALRQFWSWTLASMSIAWGFDWGIIYIYICIIIIVLLMTYNNVLYYVKSWYIYI